MLDRYRFNSPWVRSVISRWGLAAWFGRLYVEATRAWLAGGGAGSG